MLCDELIANGAPFSGCDISVLMPNLRKAQKFSLAPDCAQVADALAQDYSGLVRVFDRCRLPFEDTWIELAAVDRPIFMNAGIQAPGFQQAPKRVGFLLTATTTDLSAWMAHLFWSHISGPACCASIAMAFDMAGKFSMQGYDPNRKFVPPGGIIKNLTEHEGWTKANESERVALLSRTCVAMPAYGITPLIHNFPREHVGDLINALMTLGRSDWAGEASYVLAVIGLLNAKNALETETVQQTKLNKVRVKRGKLPLFEHKVLKIAHRQNRRVYPDGQRPRDHAPMRGHFVRGHFKTRRTGIYFWQPHARGDFKKGYIHKDYELKD